MTVLGGQHGKENQTTLQQNTNIKSCRELEVKEISHKMASQLNRLWHSRLPNIHWSNIARNRKYVCYGAFKGHEAFGVAIYSSPVNQKYDMETTLELRRLAIKPEAPKNTASRIISQTIKKINQKFETVTTIISYQDTEVHKGTIYAASNWEKKGLTKYNTWGKSRRRNKDQATGDKIRWEYTIKKNQ